MARPKSDPIKRFLAKVVKVENGCHEWVSTMHRDGYGKFYHEGKQVQAHRMAFELFVAPINGEWVLHKCDNRKCVNPDHLFLGLSIDNVKDMDAKGRRHNNSIATLEFAEKVKQMLADRYSQQYVADALGCSQSLISRIHRNTKKFFKH